MKAPSRPSAQATHLDAIRAVAALAVVLQHARQLWFVRDDLIDLHHFPDGFFYWLTSQGGPAVGVFFVLSGFLIGSSIRSSWAGGRWNAIRYADARLTRLLVPLVPALLLTAFWDGLGLNLFGQVAPYSWRLPTPPPDTQHTVTYLLGNMLFLQDVAVPTFGTNGPLWSLSREFWYYVAFPLLFLSLNRGVPTGRRVGLFAAALLAMAIMGKEIVVLFPVWLFGVAVAFLPGRPWGAKAPFRALAVLALLASMSFTWIVPHLPPRASDYAIGLVSAVFVWSVLCGAPREPSRLYEKTAEFGADISYTLYLVHVPLLTFLAAAYLRNHEPLAMTPLTFAVVLGLSLMAILYAIVLWFLFERNTRRIRAWLVRKTAPGASGA